jgi:phage gpG-like protein
MAAPSFTQIHRNIQSNLRINPKVMRDSVPQLTFSPSIGIIARNIDKMGIDIRSFKEPLKRAVQQVIIPSIQQNFEEEGRPPWDPYSASTLDIRERLGDPVNKLLNKTGDLQNVMQRYNLWTVNNNAAILLDIPLWYGKLHQEGHGKSMAAAIKRTGSAAGAFNQINSQIKSAIKTGTTIRGTDMNIPARPFVMIQPEDVPKIQEVFERWLGERVNKHWGKGL